MPQKKRGGNADASSGDGSAEKAAPKRQRVSLACDACRVARERCDGVRPSCGTCVSQSRGCSYTPASKKRGVQTGYLRTIELSLAWILFEQFPESEDALYRLLSNNGGILQKKGKSADRLHKKWSKSRVQREIGRILSGESPQNHSNTQSRTETSGEDSDTEGDGEGMSVADPNEAPPYEHSPIFRRPRVETDKTPTMLKLPSDWRRLVDIYFAYTHCWFPIVDRTGIIETAMGYPAGGVPTPSGGVDVPASYAELWAVLALAAFQDASSGSPSEDCLPPKRIYDISRALVPSEEARFEVPHIRALLLHSLVLIGQGASLAAWMVVGTATRLAFYLRGTGELFAAGRRGDEPAVRAGILALAACLVLDTLVSACLGQPPSLQADFNDVLASVDSVSDSFENEAWAPVSGFGAAFQDIGTQPIITEPLRTFRQLLKFSQILNYNLNTANTSDYPNSSTAAGDLAKSLDPRYAFCNSVVMVASTPPVPSAFLLQTAFLATTTRLVQRQRVSLISSLVEVVESCMSTFGPCGCPPLVVGFLGIIQRCGHVEKLHEAERTKWQSVLESLKLVWRQENTNQTPAGPVYSTPYSASAGHHPGGVSSTSDFSVGYEAGHMQRNLLVPRSTNNPFNTHLNDSPAHAQSNSGSGYNLPRAGSGNPEVYGFPVAPPAKSPASSRTLPLASPNMSFQSSGAPRGSASMIFGGGGDLTNRPVDYDAILEELGSIDCTDGLDVDPQFMTNLGFAPGCDLGEMFQGDLGV